MNLTDKQLAAAEQLLPRQRGNVQISNRQVLAAVLHVQRSGCSWRQLPERFGNWHTIYTRVRRWSNSGVMAKVLRALDAEAVPTSPAAASSGGAGDPAALAALADEMRPLIFLLYTHLKQERQRYRMSQLDVAAMMAIESGQGLGISGLAQLLEVQPQTMRVAIRRLASQGWIGSGQRRPGDKRRVELSVTASGRHVLAQVRAGRSDQLVRQFDELSAQAFAALQAAMPPLKKVAEGLSRALPHHK